MGDTITDKGDIPEFSIIGGPLHRMGLRSGLVGNAGNSLRLGMVLGPGSWLILMLLSLVAGSLSRFFSIGLLAGHVRLLLAVPLMFLCETWVVPKMQVFVDYIVQSDLVTESKLPELSAIIRRINRLKGSWVVEIVLFLAMFVVANTSILSDNSTSAAYLIKLAGGHLTAPNAFYIWFCLPLFRFLVARWFWHLALWWFFLYRIQRLELQLMPTHSDGVGGLGYLEVVQEYFMPLAMAFGALLSASAIEELMSGSMPFEALYYLVPLAIVLCLAFFAGPLLLFYTSLRACREKGLKEYMAMAAHYAIAFDRKWVRDRTVTGESQLGTSDLQSFADLRTSVTVIQEMRTVAISRRLILAIAAGVTLPFVPCVFLKFNINELMTLLFRLLAGG